MAHPSRKHHQKIGNFRGMIAMFVLAVSMLVMHMLMPGLLVLVGVGMFFSLAMTFRRFFVRRLGMFRLVLLS